MLSKVFAVNPGGEHATEALPEIRAKKLAHKNDHLHRTRSDVCDRDVLLWQSGLRRLAPEATGSSMPDQIIDVSARPKRYCTLVLSRERS